MLTRIFQVRRRMRERVWQAAHVQRTEVTLDTGTTVHTMDARANSGFYCWEAVQVYEK